jgi:platelet-activating factor acetylhydrolase
LPHTALVTDDSTVQYLPPSALKLNKVGKTKQRLVIFSHRLAATGEENSIFCTALAKKGYVVASVLHRDGSASIAQLPDGSWKYIDNIPRWCAAQKYCEQVQFRANEFLDACDWLLNLSSDKNSSDGVIQLKNHPVLKEICNNLDGRNVIASGSSYGAATSVLAATKRPDQFQCALLVDGWFNLGNASDDDNIHFPPDAYISLGAKVGFGIPSLFIVSAGFKAWTDCYDATCQLANQIPGNRYEMHVLPNTRHCNILDIVFFVPKWILKKYPEYFGVGMADGVEVHEMIITWTCQFLDKFFHDN